MLTSEILTEIRKEELENPFNMLHVLKKDITEDNKYISGLTHQSTLERAIIKLSQGRDRYNIYETKLKSIPETELTDPEFQKLFSKVEEKLEKLYYSLNSLSEGINEW